MQCCFAAVLEQGERRGAGSLRCFSSSSSCCNLLSELAQKQVTGDVTAERSPLWGVQVGEVGRFPQVAACCLSFMLKRDGQQPEAEQLS